MAKLTKTQTIAAVAEAAELALSPSVHGAFTERSAVEAASADLTAHLTGEAVDRVRP